METKKTLFESSDPAVEYAADLRAEADVVAGRLVSHETVRRWVVSWTGAGPAAPDYQAWRRARTARNRAEGRDRAVMLPVEWARGNLD